MPISTEQARDLLGALITLIRTARARSHRDGERSVSGTKSGVLRLVREQPARLGDLAAQLTVAASVLSRAVDALEHEGLAERRPDPDDARACLVTITSKGRERLDERERYVLSSVADELGDWTPDEADQVIRLLQRLDAHVTGLFEKFDQDADAAKDAEAAPAAKDSRTPRADTTSATSPTATSTTERILENISL